MNTKHNRYNIALTLVEESKEIIQCAEYFSQFADQYKLNEKSLPHVTICQFNSAESDVYNLWEQVCQAVDQPFLSLRFNQYSFFQGDGSAWISLLPEEGEMLNELNCAVAGIIKKPINRSFQHYDPHMTLINTSKIDQTKAEELFAAQPIDVKVNSILSLGLSDEIGQLIELRRVCDQRQLRV